MFCSKCGKEIPDNAKFCPGCGSQIVSKSAVEKPVEAKSVSHPVIEKEEKSVTKKPKSKKWIPVVSAVAIVAAAGIAFAAFDPLGVFDRSDSSKTENSQPADNDDSKDSSESTSKNDSEDSSKNDSDKDTDKDTDKDVDKNNISDDTKALCYFSYANILTALNANSWEDAGIDRSSSDTLDMSLNTYILSDLNNDGLEELVVSITSTYMAAMAQYIYYYDVDENQAVLMDTTFFPSTTFYDNGVVTCEASHNQGLGSELWPYSIYQYNKKTIDYDYIGTVDSWEKELNETDYSGEAFPDDIDKDGDGIVYSLVSEDGEYDGWYDKDDFDEFVDTYVGNGKKLTFTENAIIYENINKLADDYEEYLTAKLEKLQKKGTIDLAYVFITEDSFTENTDSFTDLTEDSIDYETDKDEMVYTGSVDGTECITYYMENGGFVEYNTAVDGVTLLGIKPGDSLDDAIELLEDFGFYEFDTYTENTYINGIGCDSFDINLEVDNNDEITAINISWFSKFAG